MKKVAPVCVSLNFITKYFMSQKKIMKNFVQQDWELLDQLFSTLVSCDVNQAELFYILFLTVYLVEVHLKLFVNGPAKYFRKWANW